MKTNSPIISSHRAILLLVDCMGGTLQGDPDMANDSRVDPETGHATVTPAGLKRKIRDEIERRFPGTIYVRRGSCFERTDNEICKSVGIDSLRSEAPAPEGEAVPEEGEAIEVAEKQPKGKGKGKTPTTSKKLRAPEDARSEAKKFYAGLSEQFTDARMFGQTITALQGFGTFRGPIQVSMGVSIDPVCLVREAITRCAVTTLKEETKQEGTNRTMGRRSYVPYALYRFHIHVNPYDARVTGCTEADYELFLSILPSIFDNDRSSSRPQCAVQRVYEIRYKDGIAAVNSERTLQRIPVIRQPEVEKPRRFADYKVDPPPSLYRSPLFSFRSLIQDEEEQAAAE